MVNWSLAQQPNAFDRAFESGFQRGEYQRQRTEQDAQRNALAGYATNPNDQTFNALAQAAPEYAMQVRGQRDQQAQEQRQSAQHGIEQFRPILTQAMQGPEQWAMARRAAAQAGMDISDVPEQFDPQWAQGQMMILDAADDGSLPSIVQEMQAAGIDVDTPEGRQVLRSALEGKYATEYVDPQGNTRRQRLFDLPDVGGQQATPAPPPGFVVDGGQPMIAPQMTVTPRELDALVRRYGPQEVQRRLDAGIVAVGNN